MLTRLLRIGVILFGVVIVLFAAEIIGEMRGQYRERMSRFSQDEALIRPFQSASPAYKGIELIMYTGDGSAMLSGKVNEAKDLDRLRSETSRLFGEATLRDRTSWVSAGEGVTIPALAAPANPAAPHWP